MSKILNKLGFDRKTLIRFLVIVTNSQLIYSFVALRSVLYDPFVETLGVSHTQFGVLLGVMGFVATYGSLAFGWVQDRFSIRKVLSVNSFLYGLAGLYIALTPTNSFPILLVIFIGFGLFADAFYWPSVLKSVRIVASDKTQATAFGFMEAIRGIWGFVANGLGVLIFTVLGSAVFGMKVAMAVSATLTILSAISVWFLIPEEVLIKSEKKTKTAFKGLIKAMKMPEVWLTGISASCVYATYAAVNTYFPSYMKSVYLLPISLVAIFGLVNSSVTRFTAAPVAGIVSDWKFKSSAHLMRLCYMVLIVLLGVAVVMPKSPTLVIPAMILLLTISILCYFIRGIYYAPIGELGVPAEMSAAAMSIAAFIGYSPSLWAYPLYGYIIDTFGGEKAYTLIFMVLFVLAIVGVCMTTLIGKRIVKVRSAEVTA